MTDVTAECEAAVTALTVEASPGAPSLAGLLRPGAVCLVWDRAGENLLWATPAAQALARHLAGESGQADRNGAWGARLHELAQAQLPRDGVRLERVRLGSRLAAPTTFACRLIALPDRDAILTIVVGTLPTIRAAHPSLRLATSSDPRREATGAHDGVTAAAPTPSAEPDPRMLAPRRFVWTSDAEGAFTTVSPPLAELVGDAHAAILGRRWADLGGTAMDPTGAVASGFAGRTAWRNATALWRMADGRHWMPVAMAAAPLFDREGGFQGFRGFGLCRPGDAELDAQPEAQVEATASEPAIDAGSREPTGVANNSTSDIDVAVAEAAAASEPASPVLEPTALPAPEETPVPGDQPDDLAPPEAAEAEPAAAQPPTKPPAKATPPLHPVFQVLLDASLSGLSHLLAALPPERRTPETATIEPAAAPATSGTDPDYGALATRIGGQLGAGPDAPLTLEDPPEPVPPTGSDEPDTPEPEEPAQPAEEPATAPLRPVLSFAERGAFDEIARALGARVAGPEADATNQAPRATAEIFQLPPPRLPEPDRTGLLERLPIGVLVFRGAALLFANRAALDLTGHSDMARAAAAQPLLSSLADDGAPNSATLRRHSGGSVAVEIRSAMIEWGDSVASLVLVTPQPEGDPSRRIRALELDLAAGTRRLGEAMAALDLAADGVVTVDHGGRILSLNRAAEQLFGYAEREVTGEGLSVLLAPESHHSVRAGIETAGTTSSDGAPRDMVGRRRDGAALSLSLTFGPIGPPDAPVIAVIMRDNARLRQIESALGRAKRASERADHQATDFLARLSHDVRTPLNAIIGFAEMMIEERFGPVGTDRYKSYLADIRESGVAVIKLVDDLLDLSRAMSGRADVPEDGIDLNEIVTESVATLQPLALRERIILRTSFAAGMPPLFVDGRSMRQVALNVLSNAIRFTEVGGQVIASTALTDQGEIALRIRDTGIGMSSAEVEAALEPFRQVPVTRAGQGRGLGLPLAKALVESNRGTFSVASRPDEGTLVEVVFPGAVKPDAIGRREAI